MSSGECRLSVASEHSVSYKARESKMRLDATQGSWSTCALSRCGDTEEAENRFSVLEGPTESMTAYSRASTGDSMCALVWDSDTEEAENRFSVLEEPTESMMSRDSGFSSILPRGRKSYLSTEEIYAIQTCTNSLQFKTTNVKAGRPRSTSLSLPNSNSKRENENDQVLWKFNFGRRGGMCPRTRTMPLQAYKDLEAEERGWNFSETKRVVCTEEVPEELRTSVMLRGIPSEYTRDDVLHLLQEHDFGEINFFYLLMNFKTERNAGYCFINFRFPGDAQEFKSRFTGHVFCETKPEESAQVLWRPIQGFASHVDHLKGSYVTHSTLPAQFKPTMFRDGKAVMFPEVRGVVHKRRKWMVYKYCQNGRNN